jgi:hypothetical protein
MMTAWTGSERLSEGGEIVEGEADAERLSTLDSEAEA